jgi:3-oxoacyl-[acyl-carrier protein] reductase
VTRQDAPWYELCCSGELVTMNSTETPVEQTRTVLITGSTSGIGAATARALPTQGWCVVVTGRNQTRGAEIVSAPEADGGRAVFVSSDLCPAVDTVGLTDTDLDDTLAVNVRAPHVLTAALAPAMAERSHGAIVSWMAHLGHPFVGLYSATKAAEIQLARSWAAEYGPRGVRVNTVSPGATRTPVHASGGDVIARMTAGTPAGRPGTPEEIAGAVAWLLSDGAGYLHGSELAVDGGITATRTA